jgi:UDP-N-acetylmuramoyl-L-alanyl-D-glutamate--2,6-diaminopimelate ligase
VFVAIHGTVSNGHDFIEKVIQLGAKAIVCHILPVQLASGVTYIRFKIPMLHWLAWLQIL